MDGLIMEQEVDNDSSLKEMIVMNVHLEHVGKLKRMLESRCKVRCANGALAARWWIAVDGESTFLLESSYVNKEGWQRANDAIQTMLDPADGGLESVLAGPPLIGLFRSSAMP